MNTVLREFPRKEEIKESAILGSVEASRTERELEGSDSRSEYELLCTVSGKCPIPERLYRAWERYDRPSVYDMELNSILEDIDTLEPATNTKIEWRCGT